MIDWKTEAERMRFDENRSWGYIYNELKQFFPGVPEEVYQNRIRWHIRKHPKYGKIIENDFQRSSLEYRNDGSIVSEKFITVRDGDEMTPSYILEAHGLKPSLWEVMSYKNNMWNTQLKGGTKQISYQSKLTAKPRKGGLDLSEIDKHFAQLEHQPNIEPKEYKPGHLMVEVNMADIHVGKLSWHGNTPENYDHKIARDIWNQIIGEIVSQIQGMPIDYIVFVWANDFFNCDNPAQTTSAGTPQDVDVRWQKLFNVGVEMLVKGIEALEQIAPVKTFYTPSNHDEVTGYHALQYLSAWFRDNKNVTINTDAYPRKYLLYGNTLVGYTHGSTERANGTKEKASLLASTMPNETGQLWAKARFKEIHAAHLHSEQMIQEINGVIVRRISSPTALDTWHTESGYVGTVRKAQTFIYDKERGLVHVINTPVYEQGNEWDRMHGWLDQAELNQAESNRSEPLNSEPLNRGDVM